MGDIVPLAGLGPGDAATAGAKAANLGALICAGMPVPPGFCLPTSVYDRLVQPTVAPHLAVLAGGSADADNRDETVRRRRALRETQRDFAPPPQVPKGMRVEVAGVDFLPVPFLGRTQESDDPSAQASLKGFAVSPGRVTATARRVSSARDFGKLQAGEILIATYVTPAWSPLLGIAGEIVTDTGGALSHGSIVAREYGIPAVMGAPAAPPN